MYPLEEIVTLFYTMVAILKFSDVIIYHMCFSWPDQGCCKYQDSIAYERQLAKKLANQGLLKKHVPPPSCSLLDIFEGEYKPLLQGHNRQYPTAIFFWTPWYDRN